MKWKTILSKKLSKIKINKIIHLAAQAGVRYAYKYPRKYFQSNLKGFFNIIEFAREKKIKETIMFPWLLHHNLHRRHHDH